MAEPVLWDADGTPRSPRFDDIYRSRSGGWQQAHQVFLHGCGLPAAWAGHRQWRVLETGFGLGLNFLALWRAWLDDPQRPQVLHHVSVEAWPVSADDILRSVAETPALAPLADELASQWWGLLPGWHRLSLAGGQVLLTLGVGDAAMLLSQHCADGAWRADSVFLDGFDPARNPQMWSDAVLAQVAALCHADTRAATWTVARSVRDGLQRAGFAPERVEGLAPKRHSLRARLAVAPDRDGDPSTRATAQAYPRTFLVIGAGVAGVAVASSLARRGAPVALLDCANAPACGASGLPAGLFAPHVSPDDAPLSQISRAGVRATHQSLRHLHAQGLLSATDFSVDGVLEHATLRGRKRPADWRDVQRAAAHAWTREATAAERAAAALPDNAPAVMHAHAGWVWPAAWIRAQLQAWPVKMHTQARVARIERQTQNGAPVWYALDAHGQQIARADALVLAAGAASRELLQTAGVAPQALPMQALRGQVSVGRAVPDQTPRSAPTLPVNGHGSVIAGIAPLQGGWIVGATFDRDRLDTQVDAAGHEANLARLQTLHPWFADQVAPQFARGQVGGWAGLRATLADRLPAVGEVAATQAPGLYLLTGMGARGLSLSVLCAELLASRVYREPLPIAPSLARRLAAARFQPLIRHLPQTPRKPA